MINPTTLLVLRTGLAQFYANMNLYMQDKDFTPLPNSQCQQELVANPGSDYLVMAVATIAQNIEFGGDHLSLFIKSLTPPLHPMACLTCVRSMLESCALAAWLADPRIDARNRINRMAALRYEGNLGKNKYIKLNNEYQSAYADCLVHLDKIAQAAIASGVPAILDKANKIVSIGMRKPSATEIIRTELNEEQLYRILSGSAHGHFWANFFLAHEVVEEVEGPLVDGRRFRTSQKTLSEPVARLLAISAARALALPIWLQCVYLGWEAEPLVVILDRVFDQLSAPPDMRFWRPKKPNV